MLHMNWNSATEMTAGMITGTTTCHSTCRLLQPSITAASSISGGKLRMNCTIMKTKKPSVAKAEGTYSGRKVSSQPNWRNIRYCGMISTLLGNSTVAMSMPNRKRRPGTWKRAKPNATNVQEITVTITLGMMILNVLAKYVANVYSVEVFQPLAKPSNV